MCRAAHLIGIGRVILAINGSLRVFALVEACGGLRLSTSYVFLQLEAILVRTFMGRDFSFF